MPGIYRVTCGSCDFERTATTSVTLVRLEDDSEESCPHPAERLTAERRTGVSWRALASTGRILYRYTAICGSCGELGYYEADEPARRGHVASIVHRPKALDAAARCAGCGGAELHLVGDRLRDVACPRCGAGRLRCELFARA